MQTVLLAVSDEGDRDVLGRDDGALELDAASSECSFCGSSAVVVDGVEVLDRLVCCRRCGGSSGE